MQGQGHGCALFPVPPHQLRQIQVTGGVSADHQHVLISDEISAVFHGPRGAKFLLLHPVRELHPQPAPVSDGIHHILRSVSQRRADLCDPVLFQQPEDVLRQRPSQQRHQGLWQIPGHRLQPRTLSTRQ